jgi:2-isopropylmalate synthase
VIEAGFPITSPGDFESVQAIAREVEGPVICGLARTSKQDVDAAWNAVRDSERPCIHTFISTSDIHIVHQLQTTREDVKGQARAAVAQAKQYLEDVEFSPMDATRAEVEFTAEVIQIALEEGATTINIPDTVGYTMPQEFTAFLGRLYELVPDLRDVVLSVHCHDDLGLAVANSFAGVLAGARQVECAVNGIGERAGNASLEEIVMLLRTRRADIGMDTGVNSTELARTSRLVSRLTGYQVQPNKAIVGRNAFAHESGIHQDGVLKERSTYEIMDATTVGLKSNSLVLGKHSGRHALRDALEEMGFQLDGQALNTAFKRFKEIADRKKQVTAMDLEALVTDELRSEDISGYALDWFEVEASSRRPPHARVSVTLPDGGTGEGSFTGDGPIDAVFRAINAAAGVEAKLGEFTIGAVTEGQDALGEVSVVVEVEGMSGAGQGVSTDIIDAAARAYVRALSVARARAHASADVLGLPEPAGP